MYFEIVRTNNGYHARIRGGNNEIMFSSQVYPRRESAIHACEVVQKLALRAPIHGVR